VVKKDEIHDCALKVIQKERELFEAEKNLHDMLMSVYGSHSYVKPHPPVESS
jgi:hypothetical protein